MLRLGTHRAMPLGSLIRLEEPMTSRTGTTTVAACVVFFASRIHLVLEVRNSVGYIQRVHRGSDPLIEALVSRL